MKTKTIINGHEIAGRMPLFQEWGRRAIRAGDKTQTRRIPKLQIPIDAEGPLERAMAPGIGATLGEFAFRYPDGGIHIVKTMKVGDIRVMTEPLTCGDDGRAWYLDTYEPVIKSIISNGESHGTIKWQWKRNAISAMYMPHEAGRTLCEITDVRIVRSLDISIEDIIAEGISTNLREYDAECYLREEWERVYDSINAKRGYPLKSNHWQIAYTFRRL